MKRISSTPRSTRRESSTIRYLKDLRDQRCMYSRLYAQTAIMLTAGWLFRYPAGHIWIHSLLRNVSSKSALAGVQLAQQIYSILYLATVFLAFKIYNKAGGMPNWIILPLVLSKRLHSIFVLRLFNDCWAVLGMLGSVAAYQESEFVAGTLLFR